MLRFSPEDHSLQQGLVVEPEDLVLVLAVEGTHSGAKTSVITDYLADKELLKDEEVGDFGTKPGVIYPYRYVQERVGELVVPIVVVSEAATQYHLSRPNENVLTTGYSRVGQAAITLAGMSHIQIGAGMAMHLAEKTQPDKERTVSLVLSDRGPLSGFAYAYNRLPDEDHDIVDLAEISDIPTPSFKINLLSQISEFTRYFDKVLITDHTEVVLEDNGLRELDTAFREKIAEDVLVAYRAHVGKEKVSILSGDRTIRKTALANAIHDLVRAHPAYTL